MHIISWQRYFFYRCLELVESEVCDSSNWVEQGPTNSTMPCSQKMPPNQNTHISLAMRRTYHQLYMNYFPSLVLTWTKSLPISKCTHKFQIYVPFYLLKTLHIAGKRLKSFKVLIKRAIKYIIIYRLNLHI